MRPERKQKSHKAFMVLSEIRIKISPRLVLTSLGGLTVFVFRRL